MSSKQQPNIGDDLKVVEREIRSLWRIDHDKIKSAHDNIKHKLKSLATTWYGGSSLSIVKHKSTASLEIKMTNLQAVAAARIQSELSVLKVPSTVQQKIKQSIEASVTIAQIQGSDCIDINQRFYFDLGGYFGSKTRIGLIVFGFVEGSSVNKIKLISVGHTEEWETKWNTSIKNANFDQDDVRNYVLHQMLKQLGIHQKKQVINNDQQNTIPAIAASTSPNTGDDVVKVADNLVENKDDIQSQKVINDNKPAQPVQVKDELDNQAQQPPASKFGLHKRIASGISNTFTLTMNKASSVGSSIGQTIAAHVPSPSKKNQDDNATTPSSCTNTSNNDIIKRAGSSPTTVAPACMRVYGRTGYNSEMNGLYNRCKNDYNNRPQWKHTRQRYWLRWNIKYGSSKWIFDWMTNNYWFVQVEEDVIYPTLITKAWCVWNPKSKLYDDIDRNIKIIGFNDNSEYYKKTLLFDILFDTFNKNEREDLISFLFSNDFDSDSLDYDLEDINNDNSFVYCYLKENKKIKCYEEIKKIIKLTK